jgi:hypothetical protein
MPRSQQGSHAQPGLVEAASAPSTPGLSRRGDAILCLLDPEFDKLYNQIKTHPQADVRQRFLEERAFRAYYLEGKVVESYDKLMAFRANVRRQKKDLIGRKGDVIEGEKLIERLCRDLDRLSTYLDTLFPLSRPTLTPTQAEQTSKILSLQKAHCPTNTL